MHNYLHTKMFLYCWLNVVFPCIKRDDCVNIVVILYGAVGIGTSYMTSQLGVHVLQVCISKDSLYVLWLALIAANNNRRVI